MTREIDVYLEGVEPPIGRLAGDDQGALSFRYTDAADRPLSLALPLREDPFRDAQARAFFDNLLQENASLEHVMSRYGIDRNDIAGLLYHLGRDCPGAISCVPAGEPAGKRPGRLAEDYDAMSDAALAEIMRSLRETRRLPPDTRDPSPLAGVQGKIAVTRLPDGSFAAPRRGAGVPTTHIVKVPRSGEESLVDQEYRLMSLARELGLIEVAEVAPLEIEDVRGLLITRFDRTVEGDFVRRIHQEDFCQALGLPKSLKYERNGEGERVFNAAAVSEILARTLSPAMARRQFLQMTLINLAVGNTDNHAKNHALLYRGNAPEMAPLYDVIPVLLDRNVTHAFSFKIGEAAAMEELAEGDLMAFANSIGIKARGKSGESEVRRMATEVLAGIAGKVDGFQGVGMKVLGDMIADRLERIRDAFCLEIEVPGRDAFALRGGGWALPS